MMLPRTTLLTTFVILLVVRASQADPPTLEGTRPFGAPRGVATEITVRGTALNDTPRLLAPFAHEIEPGEPEPDGSSWPLRLTVASDTAVGVYPLRVWTEDGISNPILFAVGQVPQLAEEESNNTPETAQCVSIPVVIEGELAGNDVDFFRFSGREGQTIVVDAQCVRIGSGVDPAIRLTTADGQFVASEDDTPGLVTDARMIAELPKDGDYLLEISDSRYQGSGRPIYRLLIGSVPVAEEAYPLGGRRGETLDLEVRGGTLPNKSHRSSIPLDLPKGVRELYPRITLEELSGDDAEGLDVELATRLMVSDSPEVLEPDDPEAEALRLDVPININGRIDPERDEDRFKINVRPGATYRIVVNAFTLGSALDGLLLVLGPDGKELERGDDTALALRTGPAEGDVTTLTSSDPSVEVEVPEGVEELTLVLRDLSGRGGVGYPYRIAVEEARPTFQLALHHPQVSIPRGGTANVGVAVTRQGYNGPITLKALNPPEGVSVLEGVIADGQEVGVLSLQALADVDFGAEELQIVGEGRNGEDTFWVEAERPIVFARLNNFPTHVRTQPGLASAPARSRPVALGSPAWAVEVVHGYGAPVPVTVQRSQGAMAALEIEPMTLPTGLAVPNASIEAHSGGGIVTVNTTTEAALGTMTIGLVAKGQFEGTGPPSAPSTRGEQRPRRGRRQAEENDPTISMAVPVFTVDVVRPAALQLAASSLEIAPGGTVECKGTIERKGPFQEAVTVQLEGLPDGLKADPVTVAGDSSDFVLTIAAEDSVSEGQTEAKVATTFKIGDADYPNPPQAPFTIQVQAAP